MYAAISPSEREQIRPVRDRDLARADAELRLRLGSNPASPVRELYQRSPARVLFPAVEAGEPPLGVLINTAGGLTGGDRWRAEIEVADGAAAVLAGQAAEKLYRAIDDETRVSTRLKVGACGWLEWLPQETILFDGARLARRLEIELAPGAQLLAVETLVFGRLATGERLQRGRLHEAWRVRRGGRLIWADALALGGDVAAVLGRPAGFDGARALATLLYAGEDAAEHLTAARELLADTGGRAAASAFRGLLLCRLLDREPQRLRQTLERLIAGLRAEAANLPARLPRVWSC
jgi:urease accessory protein